MIRDGTVQTYLQFQWLDKIQFICHYLFYKIEPYTRGRKLDFGRPSNR